MNLPPNLYLNGEYWAWRNPLTGKKYGLGRDRDEAIKQARQANAFVQTAPLTERLAAPTRRLADYVPTYLASLKRRKLAENTSYGRTRTLVAIKDSLGDMLIGPRQEDAVEITRRCSEFLETYTKDGKIRMAKYMRSALIDLFGEMAASGWLAVNPARVIRLADPVVQRSRLTLEAFKAIYEVAKGREPWVCNALALGLVTIQRREEIANLAFRDAQDGKLSVVQKKTKTALRIPTALRLDAMGWTLSDVVARCRDRVVSRWMLHHTTNAGLAKSSMRVHPQTLQTEFARCRDLAGVTGEEGKRPPSFHELRSLGIRLYQQQGYNPQQLAGHKDAITTAVYLDERTRFIEVSL